MANSIAIHAILIFERNRQMFGLAGKQVLSLGSVERFM